MYERDWNPSRLTAIDEANRAAHALLGSGDNCMFLGEYFAYQGFCRNATNQLILNFKIAPSALWRNPSRRRFKEAAVATIAAALRRLVSQAQAESLTWIPVACSKRLSDEDYDDRLVRTLTAAFAGYECDVRPLFTVSRSTAGDHAGGGARSSLEALQALSVLDAAQLAAPLRPAGIVIFDDVLTTGKHFACCQGLLRAAGVTAPITGLFVARRVMRGSGAGEGPVTGQLAP